MTTKTTSKIIPGLSLTSHQIRARLRNKTIERRDPNKESFIQNEDLIRLQKMNKIELEMEARKNLQEIEAIQKRLENAQTSKKAKIEEERINKLVEERLKQMRDEKPTQEK